MNKSRSIFIKKTKEWTEHEVSFVSEVLEHTFENMLNGNELNHEVSVLLTNDEEIRELNKKYRKIDKPTNVLSFSITSDTIVNELRMIGDIVISKEKISTSDFFLSRIDLVSSNFSFLKFKSLLSSKTCFSSNENGDAIDKVLMV